jgi:hypothetical protein
MERGARVMHPSTCTLEWLDPPSKSIKPKITTHRFIPKFQPTVSEDRKRELVVRGKIAIIATFRCNGGFRGCTVTDGVKKICTRMYELKIYYNDLSRCKVILKNDHEE